MAVETPTFLTEGVGSANASWLLQDIDIGQVAKIFPTLEFVLVIKKNDPDHPDTVGVYNFQTGVFEWKGINAIVGPHRYDLRVINLKFNNW
jgi:hypothetical protein